MTQLSLNMQSYRKSDALFCGAEIFIRYNCMCTDKFAPSFHFHPCSSLQVGSKQIGPIVYFHTRPSKWPKKKVIGIWLCFIVLFCMVRQENLGIKKRAGLAKVFGTILCVSGALLLSFYHGKTIGLGQSSIHWRYAEKMEGTSSSGKGNMFLGPLVVILSTLVWAAWFIIQVSINVLFSLYILELRESLSFVSSFQKDISKTFSAPYTSTGLMCFMASFQCIIIAVCVDHTASAWSLHNAMRLSSALYAVCALIHYLLVTTTSIFN